MTLVNPRLRPQHDTHPAHARNAGFESVENNFGFAWPAIPARQFLAERDRAFDPSGAIDFWDMTNRQDWRICEQAQLGVASRAYTPGPYSNLESMVAALDREYLSALDGG